MTTTSPSLAKVTAPPSSARPESVKNRPSQADRQAAQAQAKGRAAANHSAPPPRLGRYIDIKA